VKEEIVSAHRTQCSMREGEQAARPLMRLSGAERGAPQANVL
jgi:hypothetical protein